MGKIKGSIKKWDDILNIASSAANMIFLFCILLAICEVFRRYILGQSFVWQEDIVTYGILAAVYLYFSVTQHKRGNVEVQIVVDLLLKRGGFARKLGLAMRALAVIINITFISFVIIWGIPWARGYKTQNILLKSQIGPMWPFVWIFIVGMFLLIISLIVQLLKNNVDEEKVITAND